MDCLLTTEQAALRKSVINFASTELSRDVATLDKNCVFDQESWLKCCEFGILGLPMPEKYGGLGKDVLSTVCALEALGYSCRDNGLLFAMSAHLWAGAMPLLEFGSEEQKQRYLPRMIDGSWIVGNAVTEKEAGSDVCNLKTRAERRGDHYLLNGRKTFVSNAPVCDAMIVFATIDPEMGHKGICAFLVETSCPGIEVHEVEKMGLRSATTGEVTFCDCPVPESNRLGPEGAGLSLFTHSMEWERGCILAPAVGTMQRQLEQCIRFCRKRRQFQQSIGKFQLVASKIVSMKQRLEAAQAMLYKFAFRKAEGRSSMLEASMAKLTISESWVQSSLDAIQIHGGAGYLPENEIERDLRDALGSRLYSGTSEIQQTIIAQFLGL